MMKRISPLPSLLTLGNFTCGFIAIVLCMQAMRQGNLALYTWACYTILFAMIFDMLDGRVARMTGSASRFGGELDSLADCCSFGIAPALVVATWWMEVQPDTAKWWSFVMICGIVYASCAVLRLARYNVEMELGKKQYFTGLPSPGAAGAVVGTVLFCRQEFIANLWLRIYQALGLSSEMLAGRDASVLKLYLVGVYLLLIGLLMVSRLRFVHLANKLLVGHKKFAHLVAAVFLIAFLYLHPETVLFLGFNLYVLISLVQNRARDGSLLVASQEPEVESSSPSCTAPASSRLSSPPPAPCSEIEKTSPRGDAR